MFVHIGLILLVVSVFTIGKAGANKCKCTSTYRHATLALSISSAQVSCARKTLAAIILRLLSVGRSCRCSNCVVHTARPPNCSLAPRTASTVGSVCRGYCFACQMPCHASWSDARDSCRQGKQELICVPSKSSFTGNS